MPVIWQSRPCHKTTGASPSRGVRPEDGPFTAKGPGCTRTGPHYKVGSSSFSNLQDPPEFCKQLRTSSGKCNGSIRSSAMPFAPGLLQVEAPRAETRHLLTNAVEIRAATATGRDDEPPDSHDGNVWHVSWPAAEEWPADQFGIDPQRVRDSGQLPPVRRRRRTRKE